jgi:LuxR family glucitol operon transcriptional activator
MSSYEESTFPDRITNLPPGDYDPAGGFIGRKGDLAKVGKLILGDLYRVVTISGAGGVGKTALAHQFCQNMLSNPDLPFDGIVWVSAKEEKLTVTGIEPIEPTLQNYEDVLESILETFGWLDDLSKPAEDKAESVDVILRAGDKGVLLVIDNLETIQDQRIIRFIKEVPNPSKVLITSRTGLGEVEIRYSLKEMTVNDAIVLLRTISREKGIEDLARLPSEVLSNYVDRMSRYPLAIKWVVGQVALGKDIDLAIADLTSSTGDVAKFCFEHIFDSLLNESSRTVLYALAAYELPLVRGVLSHISDLSAEQLDDALRDLTIASFVTPNHDKKDDGSIETSALTTLFSMKYFSAILLW